MYDTIATLMTAICFTAAFAYIHACEQLKTRPRND